jgi:hypothetical protein
MMMCFSLVLAFRGCLRKERVVMPLSRNRSRGWARSIKDDRGLEWQSWLARLVPFRQTASRDGGHGAERILKFWRRVERSGSRR